MESSKYLLLEGCNGQTSKYHVHNCVPCHIPNVNGQIDLSLMVVLSNLWYMLCEQFSRIATMLICYQCSQGWHMWCLMPSLKKVPISKWFCFGAPNILRFLRLDSKVNLRVFLMVIHISLGIWRSVVNQLTMGFIFALGLLVFSLQNQSVHPRWISIM